MVRCQQFGHDTSIEQISSDQGDNIEHVTSKSEWLQSSITLLRRQIGPHIQFSKFIDVGRLKKKLSFLTALDVMRPPTTSYKFTN